MNIVDKASGQSEQGLIDGSKESYKILWVSFMPPRKSPRDAGTQSFSYFYYNVCADERFRVKLLARVGRELKDAEMDNAGSDHTFIYTNDVSVTKKLCNLDSKINPFTKYAALLSNYVANRFIEELERIQETGYVPDVVVLEWTQAVVLVDVVKMLFPHAKIVATEQDVTFVGYERKAKYYKGLRGFMARMRAATEKRLEVDSLSHCDLVIPMNVDNGKLLVREGINPDLIWGMIPFYHSMLSLNRRPNRRDLLFFGAMSREENVLSVKWFVREVMPLLDDEFRFIILGGSPTDEVRQLASERVIVTGYVENTDPYFEESMCMVVPLVLGAGIKIKVLEGLSAGIPVISNGIGIEGIHAVDGKDYLAAESANDFALAIRRLRDEQGLAASLSESGRKFMSENFSFESALAEYKTRLAALAMMARS